MNPDAQQTIGETSLRLATFSVDVTPPTGSPLAYTTVEAVDDPLTCTGIVLQGSGRPIVLAAIDWIGIYNSGWDLTRGILASAANTTPERVTIHAVHQHEAPAYEREGHLAELAHGRDVARIDMSFARAARERVAEAVAKSVADPTPLSHVGVGKATVEDVASNRRLLGPDGTVVHDRFSNEPDPDWRDVHEGLIDPELRLISFWNETDPVAALTYYATHPQSYYRNNRVTCDFPGIARDRRTAETGVPHIHFTGATGNVAAGKYNDGSEANRPVLANRVATAMETAWETTEREPIRPSAVSWRVEPVTLPPVAELSDPATVGEQFMDDPDAVRPRDIGWARRCAIGHRIPITCLGLNNVRILHGPGELFVEYQLAAQEMHPEGLVAVAAYGDGGPSYIPTEAAYPAGGYEVKSAGVASGAEEKITTAFRSLLDAPLDTPTPSSFTEQKPRLSDSPP